MIATRNGLSRSLHVGIYVIMSFLYTLLFLYVVCCQNKIILILILILSYRLKISIVHIEFFNGDFSLLIVKHHKLCFLFI